MNSYKIDIKKKKIKFNIICFVIYTSRLSRFSNEFLFLGFIAMDMILICLVR